MSGTEHLELQHKCSTCNFRRKSFFCFFSENTLQIFESLKVTKAFPKGGTLFTQGQPLDGIYMLCQGRVKLSTYSTKGKSVIVGVAGPGNVLGLSSIMSDLPYTATGEAIEDSQVNFVTKRDFFCFLKTEPDAALNAARQLSRDYHTVHSQISMLALSNSVGEKLARLLVEWARPNINGGFSVRLSMPFKHEEIAEMIGTSRETVTRLLADYKERKLITTNNGDIHIHDVRMLEAMISE